MESDFTSAQLIDTAKPSESFTPLVLSKSGHHISVGLLEQIPLTDEQKKSTRNFKKTELPPQQIRDFIDASIIATSIKYPDDKIKLIDNPDQLKTGNYTVKKNYFDNSWLISNGITEFSIPALCVTKDSIIAIEQSTKIDEEINALTNPDKIVFLQEVQKLNDKKYSSSIIFGSVPKDLNSQKRLNKLGINIASSRVEKHVLEIKSEKVRKDESRKTRSENLSEINELSDFLWNLNNNPAILIPEGMNKKEFIKSVSSVEYLSNVIDQAIIKHNQDNPDRQIIEMEQDDAINTRAISATKNEDRTWTISNRSSKSTISRMYKYKNQLIAIDTSIPGLGHKKAILKYLTEVGELHKINPTYQIYGYKLQEIPLNQRDETVHVEFRSISSELFKLNTSQNKNNDTLTIATAQETTSEEIFLDEDIVQALSAIRKELRNTPPDFNAAQEYANRAIKQAENLSYINLQRKLLVRGTIAEIAIRQSILKTIQEEDIDYRVPDKIVHSEKNLIGKRADNGTFTIFNNKDGTPLAELDEIIKINDTYIVFEIKTATDSNLQNNVQRSLRSQRTKAIQDLLGKDAKIVNIVVTQNLERKQSEYNYTKIKNKATLYFESAMNYNDMRANILGMLNTENKLE